MAKAKKPSLGRGLGAILHEVEEAYMNDIKGPGDRVLEIDLGRIRANPFQPRKNFDKAKLEELAASMLIAGERRWRACKKAGLQTIRAVVGQLSERQHRELALIENIQREDLNPIELAVSFNELIDEYGITHEDLAESVNKSRTYVTNTLRLLNLGDYAKEKLQTGKMTYGHAKMLVGLDSETERKLVDSIVNQKLTVRETEALVRNQKKGEKPAAAGGKARPLDLQRFQQAWDSEGVKVAVSGKKVTISFDSQESADTFAQKLGI